jgi:hypothetical protein
VHAGVRAMHTAASRNHKHHSNGVHAHAAPKIQQSPALERARQSAEKMIPMGEATTGEPATGEFKRF